MKIKWIVKKKPKKAVKSYGCFTDCKVMRNGG